MSKRKCVDIATKYSAIMGADKGIIFYTDIGRTFGVPITTIQTWLKDKDKIITQYEGGDVGGARKKMRTAQYPDIEKALTLWLEKARNLDFAISGPILQEKATLLATQLGHTDFTA